jgi:hypothetical protein
MTNVTIEDGKLLIQVEGFDKFWALRSRLEIPLAHIKAVAADPNIAKDWWLGFRIVGSHIPGVIAAGTFYHHGELVFWDVHNPENAIVLDLHDERYRKLVIEVANPAETVSQIQAALPK